MTKSNNKNRALTRGTVGELMQGYTKSPTVISNIYQANDYSIWYHHPDTGDWYVLGESRYSTWRNGLGDPTRFVELAHWDCIVDRDERQGLIPTDMRITSSGLQVFFGSESVFVAYQKLQSGLAIGQVAPLTI